MTNVILFDAPNMTVPAAARARRSSINDDVHTAAQFATMSIKGKVFTYIKDGMAKRLEKEDENGEKVAVQYIQAAVLRANVKARVYYAEKYSEEDSKGAKPTCFSHDGVAPDNLSKEKQAAKCALCPHAVWGTGNAETGEGTACAPNARLAIASTDKLGEPMLLRVPPGSIKSFKEAVKVGDARQAPYNSLVMRIKFDQAAPAPKLIFQPIGILSDEAFAKADEMYDSDVVQTIVGVPNTAPAAPQLAAPVSAPAPVVDELEAALAKREADKARAQAEAAEVARALEEAEQVKAKARAEAKAKAEADAAAAERKAHTTPTPAEEKGGLLGELDALLGGMDD